VLIVLVVIPEEEEKAVLASEGARKRLGQIHC